MIWKLLPGVFFGIVLDQFLQSKQSVLPVHDVEFCVSDKTSLLVRILEIKNTIMKITSCLAVAQVKQDSRWQVGSVLPQVGRKFIDASILR